MPKLKKPGPMYEDDPQGRPYRHMRGPARLNGAGQMLTACGLVYWPIPTPRVYLTGSQSAPSCPVCARARSAREATYLVTWSDPTIGVYQMARVAKIPWEERLRQFYEVTNRK